MSEELVVLVSFWAAFVIDIFIIFYAFKLSKRMGGAGLLSKTTIYLGLSGLVFGIHHILEVYLEEIPAGLEIAESIEGIAAILLGIAVYQFYKLVKGE
ncbi:hypothetical protein [Candidatus Methanoperedens nitratireducens]|uniref:Uncharacterized protein n=1 Tax=Candidatus Methanoperedens nitratireducens TaxID=1392998 RepID=A0A284VIA2_9EURY|nr:hypothetical protein [Candidatus Methanoperedens nitroreducens]SNQ58982.1 membrane hypothetical protein [Candidatus Methanoperedens nitroreducens]